MPPQPLQIKIISAGAGSGKTYSLTGQMVELLKAGTRPSGIVATTFTTKAAAELQERVRVRLLEAGMVAEAAELGTALIGTVHGLGVKLLQRFAFEAGVSPLVEIMAEEDGQMMFNQSLAASLSDEKIERLNALADRLGLTKKSHTGDEYDWRKDVRSLTEAARANDFSSEVLEKSKRLSFESFSQLCEEKDNENAPFSADFDWNANLKMMIEEAILALEANEIDTTKDTGAALADLKNFRNQIDWRNGLFWHEWAKISKLKTGAKSREAVEPLKIFAARHVENPAFLGDIQAFIDAIFETTKDALREFENYKRRRGLIDYTDMEALVNRLLDDEKVKTALAEEVDLLLVDEFQDTSPIQLSIFLKLSRLAKKSIWVGDPKQSIYGFRGAEPRLMQAIVEATGGIRPENILPDSWRSVPDLVDSSNAVFCRSFDHLQPDLVALNPKRKPTRQPENSDFEYRPLVHWHFLLDSDDRKPGGKGWLENCIAASIERMLERGATLFPKGEKAPRAVRAGDFAVLCRSNHACLEVAEALHRSGLRASIARAGLLDSDEARLVLACLKITLSSHDTLAAAEILKLAEGWTLAQIADHRLEFLREQDFQKGRDEAELAEKGQKTTVRWGSDAPFLQRLFELRPQTAELSSSEILNFLLDELDLRRIVVRWGAASQRLDNIDRMRKLVSDYEQNCARLHSAASLGGFLLWLDALASDQKDLQASGESPDAVRVMTYHKSKGLEFGATVLHSLEGNLRESIFGAALVADGSAVDLEDILGGRWLRFWVNPYADQFKGTRLAEALESSTAFGEAQRAALEEEARLFYVGWTRARDFLILPTTAKPTKWLNRVFSKDESMPVLDADTDSTPFDWAGREILKTTEKCYFSKEFGQKELLEPPVRFAREAEGRRFFPPEKIDPSGDLFVFGGSDAASQGDSVFFASGLVLKKQPQVGDDFSKAMNQFFVADRAVFSEKERTEMAVALLEKMGCGGCLDPALALWQSTRFQEFFNFSGPKSELKRAVWTRANFDGRIFEARADLVFETENETLIFVFASWTDGGKNARKRISEIAPTLFFLKKAMLQARSERFFRAFAVVPTEGAAVEIF